MFSVSHDQTLAVFDCKPLSKIVIKKKKELQKSKAFQGVQLQQNTRYPYFCVSATNDGKMIVVGSRKVELFEFDGKSTVKPGPKATDTDMDYLAAVAVHPS